MVVNWHLIAGEPGCAYAVSNGCVAVVIDALRASATAAYMLHAGATELLAVREVNEAFTLREQFPHALLAGERGGLPPQGFDLGNSPREIDGVKGKSVIFSTTTGAGRLVQCWGAHAVLMGSTVNATSVARAAARHGKDIVLVPAGLMSDPDYNAQEDWVGAAAIAMAAEKLLGPLALGEGGHRYTYWKDRIICEGLQKLFQTAPHAQNLRDVGLTDDIRFCANLDTISSVPVAVTKVGAAVRIEKA